MDSSFVIKPSLAIAKTRAMRDPVAVRGTVETDLVDAKTVTPDDAAFRDGRGGRHDGSGHFEQPHDQAPPSEHAPHDLVADPASRDVILRERDVRAEDREHPDHALLRVRAYRPAPDDVTRPDDPHADISA